MSQTSPRAQTSIRGTDFNSRADTTIPGPRPSCRAQVPIPESDFNSGPRPSWQDPYFYGGLGPPSGALTYIQVPNPGAHTLIKGPTPPSWG